MRAPNWRLVGVSMSVAQSVSASKKTISISQRWPSDIRDELNQAAHALGLSATQITVECLSLFLKAHKKFPQETNISRLFKRAFCPPSPSPSPSKSASVGSGSASSLSSGKSSSSVRSRSPSRYGFKKQIILEFLMAHPGKVFINPEIAEQLGIPESTVRRYTNELAKAGKIILIPGRPNGIKYPSS